MENPKGLQKSPRSIIAHNQIPADGPSAADIEAVADNFRSTTAFMQRDAIDVAIHSTKERLAVIATLGSSEVLLGAADFWSQKSALAFTVGGLGFLGYMTATSRQRFRGSRASKALEKIGTQSADGERLGVGAIRYYRANASAQLFWSGPDGARYDPVKTVATLRSVIETSKPQKLKQSYVTIPGNYFDSWWDTAKNGQIGRRRSLNEWYSSLKAGASALTDDTYGHLPVVTLNANELKRVEAQLLTGEKTLDPIEQLLTLIRTREPRHPAVSLLRDWKAQPRKVQPLLERSLRRAIERRLDDVESVKVGADKEKVYSQAQIQRNSSGQLAVVRRQTGKMYRGVEARAMHREYDNLEQRLEQVLKNPDAVKRSELIQVCEASVLRALSEPDFKQTIARYFTGVEALWKMPVALQDRIVEHITSQDFWSAASSKESHIVQSSFQSLMWLLTSVGIVGTAGYAAGSVFANQGIEAVSRVALYPMEKFFHDVGQIIPKVNENGSSASGGGNSENITVGNSNDGANEVAWTIESGKDAHTLGYWSDGTYDQLANSDGFWQTWFYSTKSNSNVDPFSPAYPIPESPPPSLSPRNLIEVTGSVAYTWNRYGFPLVNVPVLDGDKIVAATLLHGNRRGFSVVTNPDNQESLLGSLANIDPKGSAAVRYWLAPGGQRVDATQPIVTDHGEDVAALSRTPLWDEVMYKWVSNDTSLPLESEPVRLPYEKEYIQGKFRYSLTPFKSNETFNGSQLSAFTQKVLAGKVANCNVANTLLAISNPDELNYVTGYREFGKPKDGKSYLMSHAAHAWTVNRSGKVEDAVPTYTGKQFSGYFSATPIPPDFYDRHELPIDGSAMLIGLGALGFLTRKRIKTSLKQVRARVAARRLDRIPPVRIADARNALNFVNYADTSSEYDPIDRTDVLHPAGQYDDLANFDTETSVNQYRTRDVVLEDDLKMAAKIQRLLQQTNWLYTN